MIILEPYINKEGNRWTHTCDDCWIPDKEPILTHIIKINVLSRFRLEARINTGVEWLWPEPDWTTTHRISKRTGLPGKKPLNFPDRCLKCKAKYRRSTRMRKRISRIFELSSDMPKGYKVPKLLTFALPVSYSDEYNDRWNLISDLNKLLPKARKVLLENNVKGGTYVIECTSRLTPLDEGQPLMSWKHHPHVHMVCIARYQKNLKEFCTILMPLGLGRINYKATRSKKAIGEYVSKYLVKDNQSSRTFGIMRNTRTRQM